MLVFSVVDEQVFNSKRHVEKLLGRVAEGDVTVACWEPSQISPNHCHPHATEIYFCFEGGGVMRTPDQTVAVTPGSFVVHPPGELHEYENGLQRTSCFGCVMVTTWERDSLIGAVTRNGSKHRTTLNIFATTLGATGR
jgi:quercetin dioxygenase-like cupin family protein